MSDPIREELQRFIDRFLFYGRAILISVFLTAIFFSLYAGLRANYFTIQIITVVISTFSVGLIGLFAYFAVRKPNSSSPASSSQLNEALIRQLILDVQEMTPHDTEGAQNRQQSQAVKGGLFRPTFLLAYRVAYAFYYTLQMLRFNFHGFKSEKKI